MTRAEGVSALIATLGIVGAGVPTVMRYFVKSIVSDAVDKLANTFEGIIARHISEYHSYGGITRRPRPEPPRHHQEEPRRTP